MIRAFFTLFLSLITIYSHAQHNAAFFSRISGISNNGMDFYNVDGVEITTQELACESTPKDICKTFSKKHGKNFTIKEGHLSFFEEGELHGYHALYTVDSTAEFITRVSNYFLPLESGKVTRFTFSAMNKTDKELEYSFIKLVKENAIPGSIYEQLQVDTINFAGRKIKLDGRCRWQGVANIQCPYYGQMNWSIHKDSIDAVVSTRYQFEHIKSRSGSKILSDSIVNVTFEGVVTTARKIVMGFKGVKSTLVKMSGGNTLTIYLVASPVRGNYVSCVMSFWDTDRIEEHGLPMLINEVMQIK